MMTLEEVKSFLREAPNNFSSRESELAKQTLSELKLEAVKDNDQSFGKTIWCYEQILEIQDKFITAFFQMKAEEFYEVWCTLERVELGLHFLNPHFQDVNNEFHLLFIKRHTFQYQSLFPYGFFLSPEILVIEKTCSVCKKIVSPRNSCGHRVGEIYDGEMCGRDITKAEILGAALVKDPVQKYSVPFLSDAKVGVKKDHYNYAVVRYLIKRLSSPFHAWDINRTKRKFPHSRYSHVGRNDPCPCESGKKYKKCCLLENGVLRPHIEFGFHVSPPEHLLTTESID